MSGVLPLISSPTIQTMRTKVIHGTHTDSHPHIIRNIATSLERDISGLHQFCCETFQLYSCGKEVDFKDGLIPMIEYHKSRSLDIWLNVKLRGGVDRDEMKAVIWRFAATLYCQKLQIEFTATSYRCKAIIIQNSGQ